MMFRRERRIRSAEFQVANLHEQLYGRDGGGGLLRRVAALEAAGGRSAAEGDNPPGGAATGDTGERGAANGADGAGFAAGWNSGWMAAKGYPWEDRHTAIYDAHQTGVDVGRRGAQAQAAVDRDEYERRAEEEQMRVVADLRARHASDIENLCADLRAEYEHKLAALRKQTEEDDDDGRAG